MRVKNLFSIVEKVDTVKLTKKEIAEKFGTEEEFIEIV